MNKQCIELCEVSLVCVGTADNNKHKHFCPCCERDFVHFTKSERKGAAGMAYVPATCACASRSPFEKVMCASCAEEREKGEKEGKDE